MAYPSVADLDSMGPLAVPPLGVIFTRHVADLPHEVTSLCLLQQIKVRVAPLLEAQLARAGLKDPTPNPPLLGFGRIPDLEEIEQLTTPPKMMD
jgi:hypothetical protein